mgnify:CR=1 FL=1
MAIHTVVMKRVMQGKIPVIARLTAVRCHCWSLAAATCLTMTATARRTAKTRIVQRILIARVPVIATALVSRAKIAAAVRMTVTVKVGGDLLVVIAAVTESRRGQKAMVVVTARSSMIGDAHPL